MSYTFEFPYFSQNRAFEVHMKGRQKWIGKTKEYKNYIRTVSDIIKVEYDGELLTGPLEAWHNVILKKCHRQNEDLEGRPYGDVGNPIKVLHDAIEGSLIEDDSQIIKVHSKKQSGDENKILTNIKKI